MNGGFTKWVIGLFTAVVLLVGGWTFGAMSRVAVLESENARIKEDIKEIKTEQKLTNQLLLQLLAEEKKANARNR